MTKAKSNKRISIITLNGQIHANEGRDGINPDQFRKYLEEVISNKSELLIIDINSPGGSPVGSVMIHNLILQLREKGVDVVAHCRDTCASGGYLIVSACDKIFAYKSSIIGSIGVIMSGFGLDRFIDDKKIEYREITAGENKSFFNMFKPFTEKDKDYLTEMINDVHSDFIDIVFKSRKSAKMKKNKDEVITAKVFSGVKAFDKGLIDGFKTIKEIVDERYGKDAKVKIHRPKLKENMFKKLLGRGIRISVNFDELKNKLTF